MLPITPATELIRAASLIAFPEVARSFGLRPEALLSEVGIDRHALEDPETRISAPAFCRLLELAARQAKVETFGLHMGETRSIEVLGPIGLLVREEPTLRHAVRSLIRYIFLHNETLVMRLDEVEDVAVVSLEVHLTRPIPYRQRLELSIAFLYRALRALIGPAWEPIVCLAHEPPARRDVHHRVLGPRVDFGCTFNGVMFPIRDLDRPIAGASPIFAEHARRYLESLVNRSGATVESKVRELVRVQLSSGRCTIDRLAHQVGWDRRTLQRRLALEQITFNTILDSVRAELAARLLQNRTANLAAAADMLGFSSDSAFSRWFLGRFGSRPSEWRKQLDGAT